MLYHFYFGEVILNVIGWFLDGLMGFYCFPLLISRLKDIQYYASTLANLQSLLLDSCTALILMNKY